MNLSKFASIVLLAVVCAQPAALVLNAQPTPTDILNRIDQNMIIRSAQTRASMTITYRDGDIRELEFLSWGVGTDKSFLEFVAPARDAGSRFLRLDDNMWIFLPRAGKSVRIQGHMLRQGLMGSDFSYGDASDNPSMAEDYDAIIEREEILDGRPATVLLLTAKRKDLSYPSRRIWVDSQRWVPIKEERYARSGKLLKTATMSDVRQIGDRWYPFRIELNNALQSETSTTLQFLELIFNADVPDYIFTTRYLETGT